MTLSAALGIAQSSLGTVAAQSALISRNIANINDPGYSRKSANVVTAFGGGSAVASISRASDQALFVNLLRANSDASAQQALADGLDQLDRATTGEQSPATLLGTFTNSLQQYAAAPSNASLAQSVLTGASGLATALNQVSASVQSVRTQADAAMAASVADINSLLSKFQEVNAAVVRATSSGADVTDSLDARDKLLSQLSQHIGLSTVTGPNGSVSIFTDSGVTLFQDTARTVSFTPTQPLTAGQTGGAVVIDGVPVTGDSAVMGLKAGKLVGLAQLRDVVTVTYQNQFDEVARGLVSSFAESDQSTPASQPTIPGLFTYSGAPAMPPIALNPGLAGDIRIAAGVDPSQGGNLLLLRDGGIGDRGNTAYTYNSTGAASYSGRLQQLVDGLSQAISFDPAAGADISDTLAGFAASSVGWLEGARQTASNKADYQNTVVSQSTTALSNVTGVNLDDQMSALLDLEHSYQASAKLMSTIDSMFNALLQAA